MATVGCPWQPPRAIAGTLAYAAIGVGSAENTQLARSGVSDNEKAPEYLLFVRTIGTGIVTMASRDDISARADAIRQSS